MLKIDAYAQQGEISLRDKLVWMLRGGAVKRYHNAVTLTENTDAAHSWGVAMLVYYFSDGKPSVNLLMAALTHDLAEQVVGDVPAPTKRRVPGLRDTLQTLESAELGRYGLEFELTEEERKLLNLADAMDGMIFCLKERTLGNRFVGTTFDLFSSYAHGIVYPTPSVEPPPVLSCARNWYWAVVRLWEEVVNE